MGIFPGVGVLATLFLASVFRLNRLSALAGTLAVGIWSTFLLLPPSVAIGSFLFQRDYTELIDQFNQINHLDDIKENLLLSLSIFSRSALPVVVGFLITAGVVSIGFYFLLYRTLKRKHINHLNDVIRLKKRNRKI